MTQSWGADFFADLQAYSKEALMTDVIAFLFWCSIGALFIAAWVIAGFFGVDP